MASEWGMSDKGSQDLLTNCPKTCNYCDVLDPSTSTTTTLDTFTTTHDIVIGTTTDLCISDNFLFLYFIFQSRQIPVFCARR